jgi:hypothetical protein
MLLSFLTVGVTLASSIQDPATGRPESPAPPLGAALGGDQDWIIPAGSVVVFDTSFSLVNGQPVTGGQVGVHDLRVESGAVLKVQGPNPFVVTASGAVQIDGLIDLSGDWSKGVVSIDTSEIPEPGAAGQAGGGQGGTGSPLTTASSFSGDPGFGAFGDSAVGGGGGETGWSSTSFVNLRRGAGGGGGRFGPDVFDQSQIGLDAEPGFDNTEAENGALSGPGPAHGGSIGSSPFDDGDPRNDHYGLKLNLETGAIVVGELKKPWAGAGGGGGGDASQVPAGQSFPPPYVLGGDEKGAGGGGGGGSLHLMSFGPIAFGPLGEIRSRGGAGGGGENTMFLNRVGGGSGGGSGGHVVLETAAYIDLSQASGPALVARGGQGGAGKDDLGGAFKSSNGQKETPPHLDACPSGQNGCIGPVNGAGGDGSPGLVQLHVPRSDAPLANVRLPVGVSLAELSAPLPVGAGTPSQLLPTFDAGSRAAVFGAIARRAVPLELVFRPGFYGIE